MLEIFPGDVYKLRKPHPCGGADWKVDFAGSDIGITCLRCGHHLLLPRPLFEKKVKCLMKRGE
ncbi:MAG: DUF951 domain-containing protein [Dehalococcoides mccartyi]|jgi:Uncharacterized protein conserved in bacteria|uniref:DUF951 domain-containing protein n=1 Tax=Dehalococcoides TaxID=61434 RepID=UPI002737E4A1|nr:DUF951 domain-containing protein [Dehalococcoides mccartyi]MDP4279622.1 DUF951 domain-containing protein [Dehalococcoides mccartyi]